MAQAYDRTAVCESTVAGPTFAVALGGGLAQLGGLYYTWKTWGSLGDTSTAFGQAHVATVALSIFVWAMSVFKGGRNPDPSLVDRLWSVTPWCYCWFFYWYSVNQGAPNNRLLLMACISTLWGARLTWNFWRKGGFSGHEDYRWVEVRKWFEVPETLWKFEVFNFVFICNYQLHLVFAQILPCIPVLLAGPPDSLNLMDAMVAYTFLFLVGCEHVADLQMFAFQTEKYRRKGEGESLAGTIYENGFIETGLWGMCRHPNYFCEVTMWWVFYLFGLSAGAATINWTLAGAVLLSLLFVPPGASLDVTEMLSSRKYPKYKDYQARVSRFVPWFPGAKDKVQ